MYDDEVSEKSSEVTEVIKVRDENPILLKTPYYWSWYRSIFARHEAVSGEGRIGTQKG